MADPVLTQPSPPDPNPNSNSSTEFDSLPIPPLDSMYLDTQNPSSANNDSFITDLGLSFDDNCDFEFNFDDLDDLYFPTESEPFLIPSGSPQGYFCNSLSPESGSSEICADQTGLDVASYLDCPSEHSASFNPQQNSADQSAVGVEFSGGPLSSHGSGVSEATNSNNSNSNSSPRSPDSANFVVDQKIKVEEIGKVVNVPKRKKESEDTNGESRTNKYRRSDNVNDESVNLESVSVVNDDDDDKKKARLIRNRESAQLSRQRKKHYVEELEDKVRSMHSTIADLNNKMSYFMAENTTLRQQLSGVGGGGGMCPPPPPPPAAATGMYPHMGPMAYPWVPYAPYVVKQQGSQVPLVPIPRLKQPQQPVSASKAKKNENKKSESKTKKVASVSFLGLLCFVLLFGGLVPIVNVKYGGISDEVTYVGNGVYDWHRGRVLTVDGFRNGSDESMGVGFSNNRINCERGRSGGSDFDVEQKERGSQHLSGSDEFVRLGNDSEPLVASLYVPRNDKLVKIDGNLIIHSILASERAMASHEATEKKNSRETGLAIPRDLSPALAIPEVGNNIGRHSHLYKKPTERPKALSSGASDTLKDHMKSSAADGKLQQWFREGLAGPMLSSGMCTEVFHFDVSPASAAGAIIPASVVTNTSAEHRQNATHPNKGRNRRILHGLPVPLAGSKLNISGERVGRTTQQDNFQGNKSASSMVVSILVDPREAGDGDIDGMIAPKSLSRIFVVVLLDSVKYVTYSCVLPRSGPHLVTT